MSIAFLAADTHIGHKGIVKFTNSDGSPCRPWDDIEEHDEAIISNWNSVVGHKDKVYLLGDVVMNRKVFHKVGRLNGDKVLIKGNHDLLKLEEYSLYFRDIRAYHTMNNYILSHIPVHRSQSARYTGNIHGHTHSNIVRDQWGKPDKWYFSVSMEQINYTPISFDEIMKQIAAQ